MFVIVHVKFSSDHSQQQETASSFQAAPPSRPKTLFPYPGDGRAQRLISPLEQVIDTILKLISA